MKKRLVITILIICFIIVAAFLIVWNRYHSKRYIPPRGDEETYNLTEEEVERINANSNLLGCVLLADAPEDMMTTEFRGIRDVNDDNYYMSFPYRKRHCITVISLVSEEANIYGISVGDSVEEATRILLERGYTESEYSLPDEKRFDKYYIYVYVNYDSSQTITEIGIGVDDPAHHDVVY